jgi:hypothetical protein
VGFPLSPGDENEPQAYLSLRWETRGLWDGINDAIRPRRRSETLAAICLALHVEAEGQARWTSYSRSKPHYERPRRYGVPLYGYRGVVGAVDELDSLGLIEHDRRPPGIRGWQSAVCPRPELLDVFRTALAETRPTLQRLREPILLRNDDGELIDYRDTRETNRMRRELDAQNEALAGADLGNVLMFPSRLRRIFNEDFKHGGRFYAEGGAWQTLSKNERLRITLDGEPVVEIDYDTFHPVLAYAQCGLPPPVGTYDVPGIPRALVKIAFNILLNSSGRSGARYTLARKPQMAEHLLGLQPGREEPPTGFWDRIARIDPSYLQRAGAMADNLIRAILEKHAPIAGLFFTGVGRSLQKLDSDIAEEVMRTMRRHRVVVLPVHDSFLAPASKGDLLEEAMIDAAARNSAVVSCTRSSFIPIG